MLSASNTSEVLTSRVFLHRGSYQPEKAHGPWEESPKLAVAKLTDTEIAIKIAHMVDFGILLAEDLPVEPINGGRTHCVFTVMPWAEIQPRLDEEGQQAFFSGTQNQFAKKIVGLVCDSNDAVTHILADQNAVGFIQNKKISEIGWAKLLTADPDAATNQIGDFFVLRLKGAKLVSLSPKHYEALVDRALFLRSAEGQKSAESLKLEKQQSTHSIPPRPQEPIRKERRRHRWIQSCAIF